MKTLIFTRKCVYTTLILLFLLFNVHSPANAQRTLTISPTSIIGMPGDKHLITIIARNKKGKPAKGVWVRFAILDPSGTFSPQSGLTNSAGIVTSQLTLPKRSATLYVHATNYPTASMFVQVIPVPNRIVKVSGDDQSGETGTRLASPFVVRVIDINNNAFPGAHVMFSVISGGGHLSIIGVLTDSRGEAQTTLTLGKIPGSNVVEVRVRDVTPVHFRATAFLVPKELVIAAGANQRGVPRQWLAQPIAVQVRDKNGYGVPNVKVTFRVTAGRGTFSSSWIRTDGYGFAETGVIPASPGTLTIEASVENLLPVAFTVQVSNLPSKVIRLSGTDQSGVPGIQLSDPFVVEVQDEEARPIAGAPVTFTVIAGGGRLSAATAMTQANGQARTYLTLGNTYGVNTVKASAPGVFRGVRFNATSQIEVLTRAATHPPIYWMDTSTGAFYRLVGTKVEKLVSGVQKVTSFAVDVEAGKLYWAEQTGDRTGRIQRADFDGKNVQQIKELTSVPHSITIDTAQNKLYLTNSWGKIQRLNLDGTNFKPNYITGLDAPTDIFLDVADSKVYWAEGTGRIRRADLNETPAIQNVATETGKVLSITVAEGKVYWVEQVGLNVSKIWRIGTNGKNAEVLATLQSVLQGFAVDPVRRKLYWTNDRGKIQYSDIDKKRVRNIAIGLIRPGALVIDTTSDGVIARGVKTTPMAPPAAAYPVETVLFASYPNPFNPETWIPYQLAKPAEVTLTIYDVNGRIVRTLALGHQSAGLYQNRARAAHWDGRNTFGEPVASGVYFYTLKAGAFSATRKLLIRK